jgi:hypothetical protein
MRIARSLVVIAGLAGCIAFEPHALQAQPYIGASLARAFDYRHNWLVIGAEARLAPEGLPFKINPRLSYWPFEDGHTVLVDANALFDLTPEKNGRFVPYWGTGLELTLDSYPGYHDTNVGVNFIAGVRMILSSAKVQPYLHAQYTSTTDYPNNYLMVVGVFFPVGQKQ